MKIVFFGSSDFSIYALKACLDSGAELTRIITTPPQQKGRGLQETPTPVQIFAAEKSLPWIAPQTLKNEELLKSIKALEPDLFVVSSYGKIIPTAWLQVPKRYALNVHPSLLPRYRGAAPIHWPIILGDKVTGMSLIEVCPELDAGDIFYQNEIPIKQETDSVQMTQILGEASYDAVKTALNEIRRGEKLGRISQQHELSNYARKLTKEDGRIDWKRSAEQLANQIRGVLPWPVASFKFQDDTIQILRAALSDSTSQEIPGKILAVEKEALQIQTGRGVLKLLRVKPSGKKEMSAADWARGKRIQPGEIFPSDPNPPSFQLSKSYR